MKVVALVFKALNGNKDDLRDYAVERLYLGEPVSMNHKVFWDSHFDTWFDEGMKPDGIMPLKSNSVIRNNLNNKDYFLKCKQQERNEDFEQFAFWCGRITRGV